MQVYNGKYGGGQVMLNPMGLINDGFMELSFSKGKCNTLEHFYRFT
jgi:hypothetical protein